MKKPKEFMHGRDKWTDIEDLVQRWARRNPRGYQFNLQYVRDTKAGLKDKKYGMMGGVKNSTAPLSGTRLGLAIHPELINYIQSFYPDFLDTNEDVKEFGKRFKKFKIPEKR